MTKRQNYEKELEMSKESGCQCGQAHGACTTEFQYAVKIVCGEVVAQNGVATPVAPGRYWTAINIHNPAICQDAHFRWKVAIANPVEPGPISAFQRPITLQPDRAVEIDCPQVMQAFPQQPSLRFVKGYVVIESDVELDVVAVYSGTPGACGSNSFHTERVQPRCVPVCEDLVLPINTGFADWQTVSPTPGLLGSVAPVVGPLPGPWSVPPFGSQWVSQNSADSQGAAPGLRRYQLCFDLCYGYTPPAPFRIQVLADNTALVYLNNSLIGSIAGYTTPTTLPVNPSFLQVGRNCFRIDVTNSGQSQNPTGFALAGLLHVIRGKCPCSPLPIAAPVHGPAGLVEQIEDLSLAT
jgi:hypothetical protein